MSIIMVSAKHIIYNSIASFLRILLPFHFIRKCTIQFRLIRSQWIKKDFGFFGDNIKIGKIYSLLGEKYIHIGDDTIINDYIDMTAWDSYIVCSDNNKNYTQIFNPQIIIGCSCNIGAYNHISSINSIVIGDGTLTGKWVTIVDHNHGGRENSSNNILPSHRELNSSGPIIIGRNVWIGEKATILSNVKIGDGAIIGANTVVTKDVPANSVAVGNPMRIL